jgi:hypothetical protein
MIENTKVTELKAQLASGLITKTGYLLGCIEALELDNPMAIDRSWLAAQAGLSVTATTKLLHRLKDKGQIE